MFHKISGIKKSYALEGRGGESEYHDFLSKNSSLTVPKKFVGEPFTVSLTSCIEKNHASEGYMTSSCRNFFVSQYGKTSWGNPSVLCFKKFPVAKFIDKRGGEVSRTSVENFLSQF